MDGQQLKALEALIHRAYIAAKRTGRIETTPAGWEKFQVQLPIPGLPVWNCARHPGGDYLTDIEGLRSVVAPGESAEVFKARVQLMLSDRRAQGFGPEVQP